METQAYSKKPIYNSYIRTSPQTTVNAPTGLNGRKSILENASSEKKHILNSVSLNIDLPDPYFSLMNWKYNKIKTNDLGNKSCYTPVEFKRFYLSGWSENYLENVRKSIKNRADSKKGLSSIRNNASKTNENGLKLSASMLLFYSPSQEFLKRRCASASDYASSRKKEKSYQIQDQKDFRITDKSVTSNSVLRDAKHALPSRLRAFSSLVDIDEANETQKKYMSVSEFNKFKNKFIERKKQKI